MNRNKSPEKDDGNVEYKLQLINLTDDRVERLATQMRYRLHEGSGECIYELGVTDTGYLQGIPLTDLDISLQSLQKIANLAQASLNLISKREMEKDRWIAEVQCREVLRDDYVDVRLAVAGSANTGKSSTIGMLVSNRLDDGRGSARGVVFNHKHEMMTGRTSSISYQIVGFDQQGSIVNCCREHGSTTRLMTWPEIVENSSKILTLIDQPGHDKYLKSTMRGMSGAAPDFAMIIMAANMGIGPMTREHFLICLTLKIPFFVLVTKVDICPEKVYQENLTRLKMMIKKQMRRSHLILRSETDLLTGIRGMANDHTVPILPISNVTGQNVEVFKKFLNLLPVRVNQANQATSQIDGGGSGSGRIRRAELSIDRDYTVHGVGTVVHGYLKKAPISVNDKVMLGPDSAGNFKMTKVRSIHVKQRDIKVAQPGNHVCLALRNINRSEIRSGMVILSYTSEPPHATTTFECDITVVKGHHTTIHAGFSPVIHVDNIQQAAQILRILTIKKTDLSSPDVVNGQKSLTQKDVKTNVKTNIKTNMKTNVKTNVKTNEGLSSSKCLRSGFQATLIFKFCYRPEFIREGSCFIFREGKTRGTGTIVKLLD